MRGGRWISRFSISMLAVSFAAWCFAPGCLSARLVTLSSIEIYTTHEYLPTKPTVYFHCRGENKTILPDVKQVNVQYTFKGIESWQPLTELPDNKCKRCGFYEQDMFKSDDVYDEWELCSSDFHDGKYSHSKYREFNATFSCPGCSSSDSSQNVDFDINDQGKKSSFYIALVVVISVSGSLIAIVGAFAAYKFWQKRKREREQARFLKLFEDVDDMEDVLSLENV